MSASSRFMVAVRMKTVSSTRATKKCRQADPFTNMVHTVEKEHELLGKLGQKPDKVEISRPGFGTGLLGRKRIARNDSAKYRPECSLGTANARTHVEESPQQARGPEEWSQQNRYCGVTVDARHVPPSGTHYH